MSNLFSLFAVQTKYILYIEHIYKQFYIRIPLHFFVASLYTSIQNQHFNLLLFYLFSKQRATSTKRRQNPNSGFNKNNKRILSKWVLIPGSLVRNHITQKKTVSLTSGWGYICPQTSVDYAAAPARRISSHHHPKDARSYIGRMQSEYMYLPWSGDLVVVVVPGEWRLCLINATNGKSQTYIYIYVSTKCVLYRALLFY